MSSLLEHEEEPGELRRRRATRSRAHSLSTMREVFIGHGHKHRRKHRKKQAIGRRQHHRHGLAKTPTGKRLKELENTELLQDEDAVLSTASDAPSCSSSSAAASCSSSAAEDDDDDELNNESVGHVVGHLMGEVNVLEEQRIQRSIEDRLIRQASTDKPFQFHDVLPVVTEGASVVVQDDFSRCFQSEPPEPWNWNAYLFVLWSMGVVVRYLILFPIRLVLLLTGALMFAVAFALVKWLLRGEKRAEWERKLIVFLCSVFVMSWTGVIKYHGVIPKQKPNQIYVCNHSSMADMIVLSQMNAFSVVGQQHKGWVGFIQKHVLSSLDCVWFNRGETKDRAKSAARIKAHIGKEGANRLLIFPEGTCVNNEYCVQFKKGAFDMDAEICPIAMKYNKIFVEGYWNSRAQSFLMYLVRLMTSWAVVCDVWYLEPQTRRPGESAVEFAGRVQRMVAKQAGLQAVEWDGYMKYFRPSARFLAKRQQIFAESMLRKLGPEYSNKNKNKNKKNKNKENNKQ